MVCPLGVWAWLKCGGFCPAFLPPPALLIFFRPSFVWLCVCVVGDAWLMLKLRLKVQHQKCMKDSLSLLFLLEGD